MYYKKTRVKLIPDKVNIISSKICPFYLVQVWFYLVQATWSCNKVLLSDFFFLFSSSIHRTMKAMKKNRKVENVIFFLRKYPDKNHAPKWEYFQGRMQNLYRGRFIIWWSTILRLLKLCHLVKASSSLYFARRRFVKLQQIKL